MPPASADELAAQERAWRVDINDGVRVNIAPLQLAGLLTCDVLRPDDARKAIADRARWRSDERRWVREGVLPSLRLDGRRRAGEPALDRARAGARGGAAEAGGEAARGDGKVI